MASVIQTLCVAAALAGATADAAPPFRPLHLVSEPNGSGVRLRIVGHSAVGCDASYTLEVSNQSGAGSNRSVQRGTARLQAGAEPVTIATTTLGHAAAAGWTARLSVRSCGPDLHYEEVAGAQR